uniref:Uncharacterized protein n=1 Tax=Cannabis sativa TaxID=3483 RepID=A0A803RA02_CANSA
MDFLHQPIKLVFLVTNNINIDRPTDIKHIYIYIYMERKLEMKTTYEPLLKDNTIFHGDPT